MQFLMNFVVAIQLISAFAIIGLVLLQQGKGADMGASFGAGASGTLFGATGSANALSRATAIVATIFFVCTLTLAHFATNRPTGGGSDGLLEGRPAASAPVASAPVTGAAAIPGATPAVAPAVAPASAASQP
jgi:preprotein translocase subunit SecG